MLSLVDRPGRGHLHRAEARAARAGRARPRGRRPAGSRATATSTTTAPARPGAHAHRGGGARGGRRGDGVDLGAAESRRNVLTQRDRPERARRRALPRRRRRVRRRRAVRARARRSKALTRPGVIKGYVHRAGLNADILTDGEIAVGDAVDAELAMRERGHASRASRPSRSSSTATRDDRQARSADGRGRGRGAQLVVFPETFVPAYPSSRWAKALAGWADPRAKEAFARLARESLEVPSDAERRLGEIAREHGVWLVTGVNEVDPERPGTIYNSLLYHAPDGSLALHHRKLVPTNHERLVWGQGDGRGLRAFETPLGRIGGLICWENYMPLARFSLYESGVEIYIASTADDSEEWQATLVAHRARVARVRRRAGALPARRLVPGRLSAARAARRRRRPRPRRQRDPRPGRLRTSRGRCTTRRASSTPTSSPTGCSRSASASTPPGTTTGRSCSAARSSGRSARGAARARRRRGA